jgi:hypothetical protein
MSVAIARNWIGSWSKSWIPRPRAVSSRIVCSMFCVLMKPLGAVSPCSPHPNSSVLL